MRSSYHHEGTDGKSTEAKTGANWKKRWSTKVKRRKSLINNILIIGAKPEMLRLRGISYILPYWQICDIRSHKPYNSVENFASKLKKDSQVVVSLESGQEAIPNFQLESALL
jgi:hypothetical protein